MHLILNRLQKLLLTSECCLIWDPSERRNIKKEKTRHWAKERKLAVLHTLDDKRLFFRFLRGAAFANAPLNYDIVPEISTDVTT